MRRMLAAWIMVLAVLMAFAPRQAVAQDDAGGDAPPDDGASIAVDEAVPTDVPAPVVVVVTATPLPTKIPPTPAPQVGTRQSPVPLGTTADLGNGWTLTVLGTTLNANALVLAANQFNSAPKAGNQFFMARISATYNGPRESASGFDISAETFVVGDAQTAYSLGLDSCGVAPDGFSTSRTVFAGGTLTGNVCWQVRASDVDSLVMYYRPSGSSSRQTFLALR